MTTPSKRSLRAPLPHPAGLIVFLLAVVLGASDLAAGTSAPVSPSAEPSVLPRVDSTPLPPVTASEGSERAGGRRPQAAAAWCAGPTDLTPAAVVHHGPRNEKVVALTFDDGWGGQNLRRIVRILRGARVNATFFPIGRAIAHELDAWKLVASAGFPIGDHTVDHQDLEGMCFALQLGELEREQRLCQRLLGVAPLAVMRPPFGTYDRVTPLAAAAAGEQRVVLWDVDTRDWEGIGASQIAANALSGTNGSIIVMHTDMPSTARALPRIIRGFRARGFRFVTIGQLFGIPGAVPFD